MKINEISLSFLDGFLQGISEVDGRIREFKILAGIIDGYELDYFKEYFTILLKPDLNVKDFRECIIDMKDFEKELANVILVNPLNMGFSDDERRKYISYRVVDFIEDSVIGFKRDEIKVIDLTLFFEEGGGNRYFIFPIKDKAFFILVRSKNFIKEC